jgi:hypothetical protein
MKKKIADPTPEEQEKTRAYNREQKRRSREKQRQAAYIPTADEWTWNCGDNFPEQYKELNAYEKHISKTVAEELGRALGNSKDFDEDYAVSRVALTFAWSEEEG